MYLCILLLCIFSMHCLYYFTGVPTFSCLCLQCFTLMQGGSQASKASQTPLEEPARDQAPTPAQKFKVTALKFG